MMVDQRLYAKGEFVEMVDLSTIDGPLEVPIPRNWYILRVWPGREFKVMKVFQRRNISAWIPLDQVIQNVTRYRRGYEFVQRRGVVLPFITGAIIIPDFELEAQRWRDVEGVIGLYRMDQCIPVLTPTLMRQLRNIVEIRNTPISKRARAFEVGELVRVTSGPFSSFSARVERVDSRSRLTIGIEIFGRITPKEVLESEVEAV